jgi:phosphomevalonate kinase
VSGERQTLRGSPVVAAPGKVFLVGEYAVLAGAPAVVVAISRFAVGQYVIGFEPASEFVDEGVRSVLSAIGESAAAIPPGSVLIDSTSFSVGGKKLGLGSSAAVVVVAVGAVMEMAGVAVADNRALCFSLAEQAHRVAQGGVGSGADVAAAVHGGLIQYRRPTMSGMGMSDGASTISMDFPPDLRLVVFSEGKPASTPQLIQIVDAFAERSPAEYAALMSMLADHAETFIEALVGGNPTAAISVARSYAGGLTELGERSGAPIITPRFELAADLAINLGGMAKPSGAGGGDVGIGLFTEDVAARTFASRLEQLGLRVLDVEIDLNGVHRRRPASNL